MPSFSRHQELNIQWAHGHAMKSRYPTWKLADKAFRRMIKRKLPGAKDLVIYECRWTHVFKVPPRGQLHWHIGNPNMKYLHIEEDEDGRQDQDPRRPV